MWSVEFHYTSIDKPLTKFTVLINTSDRVILKDKLF